MRITFQFKRGIKYEFDFGYKNSMWQSMHGLTITKWIESTPDEIFLDGYYPQPLYWLFLHPKYWFRK